MKTMVKITKGGLVGDLVDYDRDLKIIKVTQEQAERTGFKGSFGLCGIEASAVSFNDCVPEWEEVMYMFSRLRCKIGNEWTAKPCGWSDVFMWIGVDNRRYIRIGFGNEPAVIQYNGELPPTYTTPSGEVDQVDFRDWVRDQLDVEFND